MFLPRESSMCARKEAASSKEAVRQSTAQSPGKSLREMPETREEGGVEISNQAV